MRKILRVCRHPYRLNPVRLVIMIPELDQCATETLQMLDSPGLLLVSCGRSGKPNVMAISWGFIGYLWGEAVFVAAVRASRFTHDILEENGEFTVNVPAEGMEDTVQYCGGVSGRQNDKISDRKLSLADGRKVKVPVIVECKMHYECRVIHKLNINPDLVPDEWKHHYENKDYHTLYFGQVLESY